MPITEKEIRDLINAVPPGAKDAACLECKIPVAPGRVLCENHAAAAAIAQLRRLAEVDPRYSAALAEAEANAAASASK